MSSLRILRTFLIEIIDFLILFSAALYLMYIFFFVNSVQIEVWVGFFAIVISIILYLINRTSDKYDKLLKQRGLLRSLLIETNYIAGSDMKILFFKRISHLAWYKESFDENRIPTHPIKQIDVDFYIKELEEKIENKSTKELKELLLFLNDTLYLINENTKMLLKMVRKEAGKEQNNVIQYKNSISEGLLRLELVSGQIINILEKDFEIKY